MIGWSDQPKSAPLPPLATVLQTTTSFIFVSTEARNKNNIMIVFMTYCLSNQGPLKCESLARRFCWKGMQTMQSGYVANFRYLFWEDHYNLRKSPTLSKKWEIFFKTILPSQNIWTLPFFMCRPQEQHCTTGFAFLIMFVVSKYLDTRYRSWFFGKLDMKPQMHLLEI